MTALTPDPITVEVVRHTIAAICEEIEVNLTRTAFSPIVYESKDFCAALIDCEGQMIGQAPGSLPVFLCDLGYAIRDVVASYPLDTMRPGDMYASNDPDIFGQHLNNVVVVMPIFWDDEPCAFVAVRAHWMDIGGRDPGGWNPDTTEIFQEGLQIPTVRLFNEGELNDELWRLIAKNIRLPEQTFGDLQAQVAACHLGSRRFTSILERYGYDTTMACIAAMWDQAEQRVRDAIEQIADGVYVGESVFDDDGVDVDKPIPFKVTITVSGSQVVVDYSELPPQVRGPMNSRPPAAIAVARIAFKMLTTPLDMANEGSFRPIEVVLPEGTFLSAGRGAPMAQWSPALATLIDTILMAMAPALPDRVPAGSRNDVGGTKIVGPSGSGQRWMYQQSCTGGWGAFSWRDGVVGMKSHNHGDSKILPTEIVEMTDPVLVESEALIPDSGGAGRFRGGLGTARRVRLLRPGVGTFSMHRSLFPPWGLSGGQSGRPDGFVFELESGTFEAAKVHELALEGGAVFTMATAGGGGWGSPLERDPALVAEDVRQGYVTPAHARDTYGVVFVGDEVDVVATEGLRREVGSNTDE